MNLLLVPAAGLGQRFRDAGYNVPKPLIKLHDKETGQVMTMLEKVLQPFDGFEVIVGVRPEDHQLFQTACPQFNYVKVPQWRAGQAISILTLLKTVDEYRSAFITNSDVFHKFSPLDFRSRAEFAQADFACSTFTSSEPCYSYIDSFPKFQYALEKRVISDQAISGLYWTRRASWLRDAILQEYLFSSGSEELFLSQCFHHFVGTKVAFCVDSARIYDFGTPDKLANSELVGEF